jgi:hypothetical protein
MDLITADGGFDFSKDFNRQEISIANLLWGQVCYAICLQKRGGNFVLKIFDVFYEHTVHILYILSSFYEEVNICKLKTSRVGNSEKYVVCRNFQFASYSAFYALIHESFLKIKHSSVTPLSPERGLAASALFGTISERSENARSMQGHSNFMLGCESSNSLYRRRVAFEYPIPIDIFAKEPNFDTITVTIPERVLKDRCTGSRSETSPVIHRTPSSHSPVENVPETYILRLLKCEIPRYFTKQIEDINAIFGQQQIENIHYTLSLIDKQPKPDKLDQFVKQNLTKCVNWCIDHSIPYNNLITANIFDSKDANKISNLTSGRTG